MPPVEHAIISGILCWRYVADSTGPWRVWDLSSMTHEIVRLRARAGFTPYPVLEDAERLGLLDS